MDRELCELLNDVLLDFHLRFQGLRVSATKLKKLKSLLSQKQNCAISAGFNKIMTRPLKYACFVSEWPCHCITTNII